MAKRILVGIGGTNEFRSEAWVRLMRTWAYATGPVYAVIIPNDARFEGL